MVNDGMAIKENCPVTQCETTLNLRKLRNGRDFPRKLTLLSREVLLLIGDEIFDRIFDFTRNKAILNI